MANFIVEMKGGDYLLVAGADNAYAAMRAASSYASTLGVPLSAKPTNPDSLEEPEILLCVRGAIGSRPLISPRSLQLRAVWIGFGCNPRKSKSALEFHVRLFA
jgi:hypothetical protein